MCDETMFGKLIYISRICVNDRYFILKEYPDRISLSHVYFLPDGVEERYKKDYTVLTSDQLFSIISLKNIEYVTRMEEEFYRINCEEGN